MSVVIREAVVRHIEPIADRDRAEVICDSCCRRVNELVGGAVWLGKVGPVCVCFECVAIASAMLTNAARDGK